MAVTNATGFSIKLFLPDGEPDGIRIVEKSNWTGQAIVIPRPRYKNSREREQLSRTGIYVLIAPPGERDLPTVYIGEGDPVRPRLDSHLANKDFWTSAVVFSSKDLNINKAHVQYLESRLISLATEAKRCLMDNNNQPSLPTLSEADIADMDSFLREMLLIFPILGIGVFEKPSTPTEERQILHLSGRGIQAKGFEDAQGFVVLCGSQAAADHVPSIHNYMLSMRENLQEQGILVNDGKHLRLSQDYAFTSPSTAAGVLLGRTANGRIEWKNNAGKTIKEMEISSEV